jgi:hypothetical protein
LTCSLFNRTTKERIRDFPTDIPLTIALGPAELRSRKLIKYINFAIANKVTLAYRFRSTYDRHFEKVSAERIVSTLDAAKKVFQEQYDYELTNVFFPNCHHHLTKQTEAVEGAGFTVFGNSVDVKKNFAHHSRSKVKHQFRKLSKKGLGAIVYLDGHGNKNLLKDLDIVFDYLRYYKFNVVDIESCFASLETPDEIAGEQAAAHKAETQPQTDGAVGFGFSGFLAAAVAIIAFVL